MDISYYDSYYRHEFSHWWFRARRRILTALVRALVRAPLFGSKEIRLMDYGCGTGLMLDSLREFGRVDGADIEPKALDYCRRRGHSNLVLIKNGSVLADDGSYDGVTCLDVIEHTDDDRSVCREIFRILKPGGWLLVTVPAFQMLWGLQDDVNHHRRRYCSSELIDCLKDSGFEVLKVSYFNALLFLPIATVRISRRLFRLKPKMQSDLEMSVPPWVSSLLERLFAMELHWLKRGSFPFGVSLLAVARKGDH